MAWYSHVPNGKAIYLALFNIGTKQLQMNLDFSSLGFTGKVAVRNLWQKKDDCYFSKQYTMPVNKHGAILLKASPQIRSLKIHASPIFYAFYISLQTVTYMYIYL